MATSLTYSRSYDVTTDVHYPYIGVDGTCLYNVTQTKFIVEQPEMLPPGDEEAMKIAIGEIL